LSNDQSASGRYDISLSDTGIRARLAVIGAIILAIAGCFAYVAGWFSPSLLTQARVIDRFEQVDGVYPGFRRNHAKGVCITGTFESNGQGERLSRSALFRSGSVPVIGRFSLGGGHPQMPDGPLAVLAMALSFRLVGGEEWRTAMIDLPIFIVKDVHGFYDQLLASKPDPATGQPDPAKMAAFGAAHPEFVRAMQVIKSHPSPSGFADASYNSLNAFRFVNSVGVVRAVRWSMAASEPFAPATAEQGTSSDKNYLFDNVIARLTRGPVQWHLIVTIGQPGDVTNDPTMAWPSDRERVDVGTLTINHAESEAPGNCRDLVFDPLILPWGIEPSDDPMLSARSASYAESFRRREGERKTPSAIQVPAKHKGS
jgi:catalase